MLCKIYKYQNKDLKEIVLDFHKYGFLNPWSFLCVCLTAWTMLVAWIHNGLVGTFFDVHNDLNKPIDLHAINCELLTLPH